MKAASAALFALTLIGTAFASMAGEPEMPPSGRLAPPAQLLCDRNQLTSYSGTVSAFDRQPGVARIEITTDWGSVEAFSLPHSDGRLEDRFLLWGEPFTADDWPQIKTAAGEPAAGLQAIVWICEDESIPPLVDWRPGAPPGIGRRS